MKIIDIRSMAAYNGWKLGPGDSGGHMQGAVALPFGWFEHLEDQALGTLLVEKGITDRDEDIRVYGGTYTQYQHTAASLGRLGFSVQTRDSAAEKRPNPIDYLPRFDKLVYPEWVHQLVQGEQPDTFIGEDFVLLEIGVDNAAAYQQGHIPGAVYLDLVILEQGPLWNHVPDQALEAALLAHGITSRQMIVIYGRDTTPAARAAVILMYAGVVDVRLLDGGLDAWLAAGFPLEAEPHQLSPALDFGSQVPGNPDVLINQAAVKAWLADQNTCLVSMRSWEEYTGETSGYEFIPKAGRIPGSVWPGLAPADPYEMGAYRNADGTMRSSDEIAFIWRTKGITPDKKIVFYCGTGWRAAEAFFCAYLMGWKQIAVFDGGWLEWSLDADNPVETGIPRCVYDLD